MKTMMTRRCKSALHWRCMTTNRKTDIPYRHNCTMLMVRRCSTPIYRRMWTPILNLNYRAAVMNDRFRNAASGSLPGWNRRLRIPKWTAETPVLYTLLLTLNDSTGRAVEQITTMVGFRSVEIENGQFLVNGKPVRFRGVNRHEQDPYTAK